MHQNQAKGDIQQRSQGRKLREYTVPVNCGEITAGKRIDERENGEEHQKDNNQFRFFTKFRIQPDGNEWNPQNKHTSAHGQKDAHHVA